MPATRRPGDDYASPQYKLADPLTRLGASLIDGAIALPALAPMFIGVFGAIAASQGNPDMAVVIGGMMGTFALTFVAILALAIYQIYRLSTTGQTIGKSLLKVKVVSEAGDPPSFVQFFLMRAFVPGLIGAIIPIVGPLFSIADPLCIFRDDRKCLHDHIAKTRVVVA